MPLENLDYLRKDDGARLAYELRAGRPPTVVFLSGYGSDMTGTKGEWLCEHCKARGQSFLRLDYGGHGLSDGDFEAGTIGAWQRDAMAVIEHAVRGPMVLVGSSMGGWIMLLAALELKERVAALVGIAAAPDFTEDLKHSVFTPEQRRRLLEEGRVRVESQYNEDGWVVTREFIEDGSRRLLLGGAIDVHCPVRLLHGLEDADVPWRTAERLMERIASRDVEVHYFKDGGHRLSEPRYLRFLTRTIDDLLEDLREPPG